MKIKIVLLTFLLIGFISGGCVTPPQQAHYNVTTQPISQIKPYSGAFITTINSSLGPGDALVAYSIEEDSTNYTNCVHVNITITTASAIGFDSSSSTTNYSVNIRQFENKTDATVFYNQISNGYTRAGGPIKEDTYRLVMGYNATINRGSSEIDSFGLVTYINFATQQDEFVVWGSIYVA